MESAIRGLFCSGSVALHSFVLRGSVGKSYTCRIDEATQLQDVDHLVGRRAEPGAAVSPHFVADTARRGDIDGGLVETNDGGVEVEVAVDGHGIAYILWEPELVREKHKGPGERVIELAMPLPVLAVFVVLGPIVWLPPVDVLRDLDEDVAVHASASKCTVVCTV